MTEITEGLLREIRDRFAWVDSCPEQGRRIFFENAGGALTLKSVVEAATRSAAIPDNQGRANPGSRALVAEIDAAVADMQALMNASGGQFFVGESGTELLFRLVMNATLAAKGGVVLGSTLEHPATRSACHRWARQAGLTHRLIPHDDETGTVTPEAYAAAVTPETVVTTIIHTSPVTGMGVDLEGCAKAIRAVAPECLIIVDGIQHAAHGGIDLDCYDVDGYVISPYKMFSRHGYGLAWISGRMTDVPHDCLLDGPPGNWSLGTRDTGAYTTFRAVVAYLEWLGGAVGGDSRRERFVAAAEAIRCHERRLTDAMIHGLDNLPGLASLEGIRLIGGADNPAREGLVSFAVEGVESVDLVERLNQAAIRTHLRKADHYSANILTPLGLNSCVRVSLCHYNSLEEVRRFLEVMINVCTSPGGKV